MRAPPDTVNVLGTITKMNFLSGLMGHAKQRARERDQALSLYVASVEQARRPGFYTDCGIADTLDGRFDLIVLHVYLVVRTLRPAGEQGKRLADLIFKIMMDDMDMNLREMGVGDLSVGKRVKAMARAFYGRAAAYDAALDGEVAPGAAVEDGTEKGTEKGTEEGDKTGLEAALSRNIYGAETPESGQLARLTDYVRRALVALERQPADTLLTGDVAFPPAPQEPAVAGPQSGAAE